MTTNKPNNNKKSTPKFKLQMPNCTRISHFTEDDEEQNKEKKMKMNKNKKVKEESSEFEFCKLCRINHNQGRRHNFFPRHKNSLSSLFSRFTHKLSFVNSSLKNPSFSLSSSDSIWCIFCDFEIDEFGTTFASGNAIKHLASEDHLKNLKHFLWKYGGGMNKVDCFSVTEVELAKWEKKCEALKQDAPSSSEMYHGSSHGKSIDDIQTNYDILNSFNHNNNIHFLESSLSNDVMPLRSVTNENYQVYHSNISETGKVGLFQHDLASHMPMASQYGLEAWSSRCTGQNRLNPLSSSMAVGSVRTGVGQKESVASKESITEGYQSLTQISCGGLEGNVHSGALPPWLKGFETCDEQGQSRGSRVNVAPKNDKKTNKLNPRRVGAAWAEKRKLEMEMEKRGEIIVNGSDANWLPNFGRVWQSGSRKESMKEFKKEKLNLSKPETHTEPEIKLYPYISKRMRRDTNGISLDAQKTDDFS